MTLRGAKISRGKGDPRKRLTTSIMWTLKVLNTQGRTPIAREELIVEAVRASGRTRGDVSARVTELTKGRRIRLTRGLLEPRK